MILPNPNHFFGQLKADITDVKNYLFDASPVSNKEEDQEGSSAPTKPKFSKIEFANTCLRLGTVAAMAYSIYWVATTLIGLLQLIQLPVKFTGIGLLYLAAFEGYVYSMVRSAEEVSLQTHVQSRKEEWDKKIKNILEDSRVLTLKTLISGLFSKNIEKKDQDNANIIFHS